METLLPPEEAVSAELRQLRRLDAVSLCEGTTLILLLFVAVPLKHVAGWDFGVHISGPVHGFAFMLYGWVTTQTIAAYPDAWTAREKARLLLAAFVPFGGFTNVSLLSRRRATLLAGVAIR